MNYEITDIERAQDTRKTAREYFSSVFYKAGGVIEVLLIIFIWLFIFSKSDTFGDFTRYEMVAYILFGNMIGVFTGFFLHNLAGSKAGNKKAELMMYTPIKYFLRLFTKGLGTNFIPFLIMIGSNIIALYFLQNKIATNFELSYLLVIALMLALSFIIEFLLTYLGILHIFWLIESEPRRKFLARIKKFFAGSYIPLSLLPWPVMYLGLIFPFAYAFFVPGELYLRKTDIKVGVYGLFVQVFWIIALYVVIKRKWRKQKAEIEPEVDKVSIDT